MIKKMLITFGILVVLIVAWLAIDFYRNEQIKRISARPDEPITIKIDDALYAIEKNKEFNFDSLEGTFKYVKSRYDCSDFRLQSMTRLIYEHKDKLPKETFEEMKQTFLNFRYWMDQPGDDAMCFWSENHQLLFATSEYLAGQYFPDEIFVNDGKTGKEHIQIGKERLLYWLEQRWLYGFTEWYSNTYYVEDIAPLSNLIDFAKDDEISKKAQIIMDLLLNDLATQSYKGIFISSSGRAYEQGKKSNKGNSMRLVSSQIWKNSWNINDSITYDGFGYRDSIGLDLNFLFIKNYKVPEAIHQIGLDTNEQIIRASNGLNLSELKGEGLNGTKVNQIMMQLAMEAFTNPEVVTNSVTYINRNHLLSNEFLHDFKLVNFNFFRLTGLLPAISRMLNPVTNGTAIERANVYNYKTKDYMLVTAQKYHPGEFGDQHHIWNATISEKLCIFTTHPAIALSEAGALSNSPGYWVGNGRNPHSAQFKNMVMSIYQIPEEKGFMEKDLVKYTHAYFPKAAMDECIIENNYAFGRLNDVYFSFIAKNPLNYADNSMEDLIQKGVDTYWIFEISTAAKEGNFNAFMQRILKNKVQYENKGLNYFSNENNFDLTYKGDFKVNNEIQETEYKRFDSKYSVSSRKPENLTIQCNGYSLYLDFYKGIRTLSEEKSNYSLK